MPLLYAKSTFIFQDSHSLLGFSGSILPQRLQTIRSIKFDAHVGRLDKIWMCDDIDLPLNYYVHWNQLPSMGSIGKLECRNKLPAYTVDKHPIVWQVICDVISRMEALKKLDIALSRECCGSKEVDDASILKPLIELGTKLDLQDFSVEVEWKAMERSLWEVPNDAPFILRRRPVPIRDLSVILSYRIGQAYALH